MNHLYKIFFCWLVISIITLYGGNKESKNKKKIDDKIEKAFSESKNEQETTAHLELAKAMIKKDKESLVKKKKDIQESIIYFENLLQEEKVLFFDENGNPTELNEKSTKFRIDFFEHEFELKTFELWLTNKMLGGISNTQLEQYLEVIKKYRPNDFEKKEEYIKTFYNIFSDEECNKKNVKIYTNEGILIPMREMINLYKAILEQLED